MTNFFHTSVLMTEVLTFLAVKEGERYIDATLGGAGHSREILARGGQVLGIDQDPDAISFVQRNMSSGSNFTLKQGSFEHLQEIATEEGFLDCSGVLFDLGVSSYQLDSPLRGFSFRESGPLDMRMDPNFGVTAKDLVNALNEGELEELFTKYGEERWAKKIAKRIVSNRVHTQIETTEQLADLIVQTVGFNPQGHVHPATRVFQALRIAVNDELNSLKVALPQALDVLKSNGVVVVISFHSLEDRVVKNFFKEMETAGKVQILTDKPVEPTKEEIESNPRSRSAKLRAARKV